VRVRVRVRGRAGFRVRVGMGVEVRVRVAAASSVLARLPGLSTDALSTAADADVPMADAPPSHS